MFSVKVFNEKEYPVENRIKLKILGITYSQIQNGAYALVLAEEEGLRRIPIIIGTAEAQSIAIRLEHLTPPRPMTHDLFVSFAHGFGIRLLEVFIYSFEEGVFSSELLFEDENKRQIRIDSRTSDAIAIALRAQAPIYTTPEIISEAGIIFEEESEEETAEPEKETGNVKKGLEELSIQDLEKQLEKAIRIEAYEVAANIQQEINRRNKKEA
nr:bifunctional nuclease family protein [Coprobacter tertius]